MNSYDKKIVTATAIFIIFCYPIFGNNKLINSSWINNHPPYPISGFEFNMAQSNQAITYAKDIRSKMNSSLTSIFKEIGSYFGIDNPSTNSINTLPENTYSTVIATNTPKDIVSIISTIPTYETASVNIRKTVINIICEIPDKGEIVRNISSSGVIISKSGLVLTNAHVGIHVFLDQYTDRNENCIAKSDSPSSTVWPISLVYISPEWTARHPGEIHGALNPDTGESDFAILKISALDNTKNKKDKKLDYLPLLSTANILNFGHGGNNSNDLLKIGQNITLIAYPVGESMIYSPNTVQELEVSKIDKIQTFIPNDSSTPISNGSKSIPAKPIDSNDHKQDLIVTALSKIGRSGSSGGAIINENKYLIGIIANIIRPPEEDGSMRYGTYTRGITTTHINNELIEQTGKSLFDLIYSDENDLRKIFESKYQKQVERDLLINFLEAPELL